MDTLQHENDMGTIGKLWQTPQPCALELSTERNCFSRMRLHSKKLMIIDDDVLM